MSRSLVIIKAFAPSLKTMAGARYANRIDQSICTLIPNLSSESDIFLGSETLKKLGPKYGVQKTGCKNQGNFYIC